MKWLWIVLAVLAALVLIVVVVGALLPAAHTVARKVRLPRPPAAVFTSITEAATQPGWRPGLKSVEALPSRDGKRCYREVLDFGPIDLRVEVEEPGHRLITRIVTERSPFGGTWTFLLTPTADGTELSITEHGEVHNVVFRFLSRFVFGHSATIDAYLGGLAKHCGGTGAVQAAEPAPQPPASGG